MICKNVKSTVFLPRQPMISYTTEWTVPCKMNSVPRKQSYVSGHSTWQPLVEVIGRVNGLTGLIDQQTYSSHSMQSIVFKGLLATEAHSPANLIEGKSIKSNQNLNIGELSIPDLFPETFVQD